MRAPLLDIPVAMKPKRLQGQAFVPANVARFSRQETDARARIVHDVVAYLADKDLPAGNRRELDYAAEHPDAIARDRVLEIAAPFYAAEIRSLLPQLQASSAFAARAYAKIAAEKLSTDSPSELRSRAAHMRDLASRQ